MKITEDGKVVTDEQYRAVLVAVEQDSDVDRSLDELAALAKSAGVEVAGRMTQKLSSPDPRTYIGSGKLVELKEMAENMEIDTVILNDELSSSQLRHLEAVLDTRIIDRTVLILDIFANRAKSKEGKLQVELAQLQYRLPRLRGIGKTLSRLGGGIGTRGPGEKKLETDRRHITRRMDDLKKTLKEVETHREVQRASRQKNKIPVVALVGYTNAGKSATMNRILEATSSDDTSRDVLEEDKLFATLDTFQRKIKLDSNEEFILVDTVGFVSKLPHDLVMAFKATLEEVVDADLLIHIVDASYSEYVFQIEVVDSVLKELGADHNEEILVYNKMDLIERETVRGLGISAKTGQNIDMLLDSVREKLFGSYKRMKLMIPFDRGDITSYLIDNTNIIDKEYTEEGTVIEVDLSEKDAGEYARYQIV